MCDIFHSGRKSIKQKEKVLEAQALTDSNKQNSEIEASSGQNVTDPLWLLIGRGKRMDLSRSLNTTGPYGGQRDWTFFCRHPEMVISVRGKKAELGTAFSIWLPRWAGGKGRGMGETDETWEERLEGRKKIGAGRTLTWLERKGGGRSRDRFSKEGRIEVLSRTW